MLQLGFSSAGRQQQDHLKAEEQELQVPVVLQELQVLALLQVQAVGLVLPVAVEQVLQEQVLAEELQVLPEAVAEVQAVLRSAVGQQR